MVNLVHHPSDRADKLGHMLSHTPGHTFGTPGVTHLLTSIDSEQYAYGEKWPISKERVNYEALVFTANEHMHHSNLNTCSL